ncbi:hypothetical protein C6Q09_26845, partial [Burkholderia multivorans]
VVPMPEVNSSPRKLTAPQGLYETVSYRHLHVSNTTNRERVEHAIGNSQIHITSVPVLLYLCFHFKGVTCKEIVRSTDNFGGSAHVTCRLNRHLTFTVGRNQRFLLKPLVIA